MKNSIFFCEVDIMKFTALVETDVGNTKKTNQDSSLIKIATTPMGKDILLAVLCDGMGGLQKGELASATAVRYFERWFYKELPYQLKNLNWEGLSESWKRLIENLNTLILRYGEKNKITLGTTLTAFLSIDDSYMIAHVGDSRAYRLHNDLKQLTEDHTYVAREVKRGNMTYQEAKRSPRRNVLLQCIGASKRVVPELIFGKLQCGSNYLLCSDGFRNEISPEEIFQHLKPGEGITREDSKSHLKHLINTAKERKERDNLTAILIKVE
ncbi:PP2C family protein-serine/threonine phosphatase [Alloiococcus sp. CFN-8]|uniref:PP2C family protein-serine/threonine phosphatase n=1 Tax=Alloiococcus sp. CFN-8 TaxID=3416081 RepID=UPI003CECA3FC